MATTTYKLAYLPTVGGDSGTWGTLLNTTTFPVFDKNLGGIVTKSLASGNVSLSASESQNAILRLTGALTAARQVTTSCQGFTLVENATTGAYDVTISNGVGTPVTIPRTQRCIVITDSVNGPRIVARDGPFDSGTEMLFVQTSAPTGWTKSSSHNDKALRIVSGTASSGGSTAFSSVFASQTPAGTVGNTTLTIDQIPLHGHAARYSDTNETSQNGQGGMMLSTSGDSNYTAHTGTPSSTIGDQIGGTGGGNSHTHSFTGNAMDFAVNYVDAIIAAKD